MTISITETPSGFDISRPKFGCDEPLTEGVGLDYCTNNWCGA